MNKPRKICCRITPGRVMGTVLLAASMVNLIIVGAAFEAVFSDADPTITATSPPATTVSASPAMGSTPTITLEFTAAPTQTPTITPTATFTATPTDTATPTGTASPSPTACILRYRWQVYIVQAGDTLYSLAITTGSSISELMRANCLTDTIIYRGQQLYVPRLPVVIAPATITPTFTATPRADTPTTFRNSSLCVSTSVDQDQPSYTIYFSVEALDPDGIQSLSVFYRINESAWVEVPMYPSENYYAGSRSSSGESSQGDMVRYYYKTADNFGNFTESPPETATVGFCGIYYRILPQ